ncbi:hypothetical protein [Acinetobacter baumannii]|uniref:hypothetical protein n=1 Tax=Acinetobacter baumannii TaxID=470 RepID=UPI0013A59F9F|nr:hypothetical protein [Acinetobacter baumannii]
MTHFYYFLRYRSHPLTYPTVVTPAAVRLAYTVSTTPLIRTTPVIPRHPPPVHPATFVLYVEHPVTPRVSSVLYA